MKPKARYVLRPEARPLRWDLLNDSQQNAFHKILGALDEARRDIDESSNRGKSHEAAAPNLPHNPDRFRSSRLVFLSGKRGTGKSTVLVSLFEAFLDPLSFCRADNGEKSEKSEKSTIKHEVEGLQNRLIWLEPLDMEPLPRPVNLLAAVLARIDRAATRFTQRKEDKSYQSGLLSLGTGEKALHHLRRLAADVAIAWDGNVDERAGALDPDAYAAEVNRVEEARVGINADLNESLCELAQELGKSGYVKDPLFVLPVDDYDLNPLRSLELLHLIRMISSPRLFIIILGDIRTAEIMFNLKKSGDFAKVLEAAYSPKYLSLSASEISGIVRSLSGHAIRKLVPPGQRIELGGLRAPEALKFHPRRLGGDKVTYSDQNLQNLLQRLPVDIETAMEPPSCFSPESDEQAAARHRQQSIAGQIIPNLKEFLCFNVRLQELPAPPSDKLPSTAASGQQDAETAKEREQQKHAFPYTGAALLKATPRYIADLWFSIRELLGDEDSGAPQPDWPTRLSMVINFVGMETHRALEEDELLSIRYRERFVEALGVSPDEEWLQAMKFIEARSVSVPGRIVLFRDHDCVLHANYRRSWAFWDLDKKRPVDIAERTKTLIVLLHDLLALERWGGIVGSHALSPNSLDLGWAVAAWDIGLREEVRIPWLTPAWTSFWEFDQFSHIWDSALKSNAWKSATHTSSSSSTHSGNEPRQRAFLLYTWIAGICRIFEAADSKKKLGKTIPASFDDVGAGSHLWGELASSIRQLILEANDSTARAERIRSWLIRLPVLLAPESGLVMTQEHSIFESCARTLLDPEIWMDFLVESRIQKIRYLRADRLAPFLDVPEKLDMMTESQKPSKAHPVNAMLDGALVPKEPELRRASTQSLRRTVKNPQEPAQEKKAEEKS